MDKVKPSWSTFLWDIFMCSVGSYGGPEAHYGVFSSILVKRRQYLREEDLTEMIGLYALVPGPSSTQTITAIGYHVGGPVLAILTFLVWALPAIVTMTYIGVFFSFINATTAWEPILDYLPAVAIAFILYAAWSLSKKVLKNRSDILLYGGMFFASLLFVQYSVWVVPGLLITGGLLVLLPHWKNREKSTVVINPRWMILIVVLAIAVLNEGLAAWVISPWTTLFTSFYRYGYSVIGGGQIVIPLMIQDLVQSQSLVSLHDFLSGYAIDQAIPGPLFSFAAFVSARSFASTNISFIAGLLGGLSIFLPGILLVFFISPLWKNMRQIAVMKFFLKGVTVTAAALIAMTAVTQLYQLPVHWVSYGVILVSSALLISKKVPAPFIVVAAGLLGFII